MIMLWIFRKVYCDLHGIIRVQVLSLKLPSSQEYSTLRGKIFQVVPLVFRSLKLPLLKVHEQHTTCISPSERLFHTLTTPSSHAHNITQPTPLPNPSLHPAQQPHPPTTTHKYPSSSGTYNLQSYLPGKH